MRLVNTNDEMLFAAQSRDKEFHQIFKMIQKLKLITPNILAFSNTVLE